MRVWLFTKIWNWKNKDERDNRAKRKRFKRDLDLYLKGRS